MEKKTLAPQRSNETIPCLYVKTKMRGKKCLIIHFHANAEDLSHVVELAMKFSAHVRADVLAMEYPGYGVYE